MKKEVRYFGEDGENIFCPTDCQPHWFGNQIQHRWHRLARNPLTLEPALHFPSHIDLISVCESNLVLLCCPPALHVPYFVSDISENEEKCDAPTSLWCRLREAWMSSIVRQCTGRMSGVILRGWSKAGSTCLSSGGGKLGEAGRPGRAELWLQKR